MTNKRLSFVNFPIPFDHPYILPTLFTTMTVSAVAYYALQASHHKDLVEALRKQHMRKRRHLHHPEDRYASLQIESSFVNPFEAWHTPSWKDDALYWLKRSWQSTFSGLPDTKDLDEAFPLHRPDFDRIFTSVSSASQSCVDSEGSTSLQTTFTWLGQSTCLITLDGLMILTDPVFDDALVFHKRARSLPCKLDAFVDKVDIVLISHDHAGHLDEHVVKQLGDSVTWYVPLGLRDWFVSCGVENVIELDWWQEVRHKERPEVIIASVPSMHSSGRWSFKKNQALWSNFVVRAKDESFFFCGASGYDKDMFKAIGKVYAPLTLAALPIGGYMPRNVKKALHMDPAEALRTHHHLGCPRLSIGINWGTFVSSSTEPIMEPRSALAQTLQKHPLPSPPSPEQLHESTLTTTPASPSSSSPTSLSSLSSSVKDDHKRKYHANRTNSTTEFTTVSLGETICVANLGDDSCNPSS